MARNRPNTTRIADDTTVTVPQTTDAGDAPADTLDPLERASSVFPDTAAAAAAGHLTVNAIVPVDSIVEPTLPTDRVEVVTVYGNDGITGVTVVRSYGNGISSPSITRGDEAGVSEGAFYAVSGGAFVASVGGTTGTSEPTWPSTVGDTVIDGSVTWLRVA